MSFNVKYINPQYFLVRISKDAQLKKRSKKGLIHIHVQNAFMEYNMQHGEILAIGQPKENGITVYQDKSDGAVKVKVTSAQEYLPQARVGDMLLFHHFIEGSVESKEEGLEEMDLQYMADQDETWRYYWVKTEFAYAVAKADGAIFVSEDFILARPATEETDTRSVKKIGNLFLFNQWIESRDIIQQRIDYLKLLTQQNATDEKKAGYMAEMEQLTKKLNVLRLAAFVPLVIHENYSRDCGQKITDKHLIFYQVIGSKDVALQVTKLEYNGVEYSVLRSSMSVAVALNDKEEGEGLIALDDFLLKPISKGM